MSGRKRVAVTELFKDLENSDTKVPRVQCLFCQSSVVKNGTQLKTHIEQCLSCLKLLKQKFVDESYKIMKVTVKDLLKIVWLIFLPKT